MENDIDFTEMEREMIIACIMLSGASYEDAELQAIEEIKEMREFEKEVDSKK